LLDRRVGWSTERCCRKARQLWYAHCATSPHQGGRGASLCVASTSRSMPRIASSSPSGAEPVPTSCVTASSNFHDGRHSCDSSSPQKWLSWHESETVRSHISRQPRKSSYASATTVTLAACSAGSAAASVPARNSPYPCPSETTPPAAPPALWTTRAVRDPST